MLGDPRENPIAAAAVRSCGDRVRFLDGGFSVAGKMYEGAAMALLVSCRREEHPGSVVTLLYGVTPQALGRVARLLFFTGGRVMWSFRKAPWLHGEIGRIG